jgi:hypothetical protein
VVQGAVEEGDRVAGEVDPVAVDGGMGRACAVGGLRAGEGVAAEAVRPVGGQGGVGAAGGGVFGGAAFWCEVPGDEVIAAVPVRCGGGDDDPADAVSVGQAGWGGEVGSQPADGVLVAGSGGQVSERAGGVGGAEFGAGGLGEAVGGRRLGGEGCGEVQGDGAVVAGAGDQGAELAGEADG